MIPRRVGGIQLEIKERRRVNLLREENGKGRPGPARSSVTVKCQHSHSRCSCSLGARKENCCEGNHGSISGKFLLENYLGDESVHRKISGQMEF
jgi:hypothetical protein